MIILGINLIKVYKMFRLLVYNKFLMLDNIVFIVNII